MGLRSSIGKTIFQLRTEKKKRQEEVARDGGLSRKHFSDIEKGVKMVSVDILLKIAKGLEISLIDLLGRVDYEGVNDYIKPVSQLHEKIELKTKDKNSVFFKGELSLLEHNKRIAIIGSKTPSSFAIDACKYITQWFVERDYVIVTGLAKGIDTIVHQTCLKNNGKIISVLPSGIGNIFPPENKDLAEKIVKSGGLLVSEYPEHSSPKPKYYEDSNKIIANLGLGVIVFEPQVESTSMRTAIYVLKQKGNLACIEYRNPKISYKTKGNAQLLKEHKEIFKLRANDLPEFERKIYAIESSI